MILGVLLPFPISVQGLRSTGIRYEKFLQNTFVNPAGFGLLLVYRLFITASTTLLITVLFTFLYYLGSVWVIYLCLGIYFFHESAIFVVVITNLDFRDVHYDSTFFHSNWVDMGLFCLG